MTSEAAPPGIAHPRPDDRARRPTSRTGCRASSSCCSTSRSSSRSRASPRSWRTASPSGHALDELVAVPPGVLRDLVGVDELHLVRLVLRHRRRPVPAADHGADGRRARARRGRARGLRGRRLPRGDLRLPDHADRAGRPVAAGRRSRTRPAGRPRSATPPASPSSRCGWLLRLCLAETGVLPLASLVAGLRRPRRPRARGPAVGGAAAVDQLASAPHRRALRPVHDHPARRERPRRLDRACRRRSRRAARRRLRDDRARRAGAGVRALVAVLPRSRAADGLADHRDRSYLWGYGHYGIFAALGRGRRGPRGRRRADRAPPGGVGGGGRLRDLHAGRRCS